MMDVLDADQANEVRMSLLIIEREFDHAAYGIYRRQAYQVEFQFHTTDIPVNLLQYGKIESFFAAEIVIDHPFCRTHAGRDRIYACPTQSMFGEFLPGDTQYVLACTCWIRRASLRPGTTLPLSSAWHVNQALVCYVGPRIAGMD